MQNTQQEIASVMTKLRRLAQHWERLLFSTGGAINVQKSHWYIMTWNWKGGTASLANTLSTPVQLLIVPWEFTYLHLALKNNRQKSFAVKLTAFTLLCLVLLSLPMKPTGHTCCIYVLGWIILSHVPHLQKNSVATSRHLLSPPSFPNCI